MKKEFKTTIVAFALVAAGFGAFASDIKEALTGKKLVNTHEWQKYLPDGVTEDGDTVLGDESSPFAEECQGLDNICAIGTPIGTTGSVITLRYE